MNSNLPSWLNSRLARRAGAILLILALSGLAYVVVHYAQTSSKLSRVANAAPASAPQVPNTIACQAISRELATAYLSSGDPAYISYEADTKNYDSCMAADGSTGLQVTLRETAVGDNYTSVQLDGVYNAAIADDDNPDWATRICQQDVGVAPHTQPVLNSNTNVRATVGYVCNLAYADSGQSIAAIVRIHGIETYVFLQVNASMDVKGVMLATGLSNVLDFLVAVR